MITKGKEIDLGKPIFVYYLKVGGVSPTRAHEWMDNIYETFPSNVNLWIVPIEKGDSKIECVYNGVVNVNQIRQMVDLINKTDSTNFSELKSELRELLLNQLFDEPEKV
jgi:hypothetical protein